MTEADSPGTRRRIEVIDPPYIEPYQMPASMMMADIVSRKYVMGRSSAMVAAEPNPGRMPMTTPRATPAKHNSRFIGCSETENPSARFETNSMRGLSGRRCGQRGAGSFARKCEPGKVFCIQSTTRRDG